MSRPIRLVYLVPDLGLGGAERHAVTLLSRMDRARFEPRLVCLGAEGELFAELEAAGVPAVALGMTKRQALRCVWVLLRLLRATRPDVVIARGYSAEVLGRAASLLARVPVRVVWVHNCGDVVERGAVRRTVDRLLDPSTDAFFAVTPRQVPYLVDVLGHPATKIVVLPNGIDVTARDEPRVALDRSRLRAELGAREDEVVVGIVAALRKEKDHETFLEAARMVTTRCPRTRFVVVGGGERRATLEAHARRLGIEDRTSFMGPRPDVDDLLGAMDIFVLSSYTVECAPLALLEAMAAARPVVCTAVGGVPDIVEDGVTGHLVPARAPAALAERIVELVLDAEQRRAMGDAGRARVLDRFTSDKTVRDAESALEDLVNLGKRPVRLDVVLDETHVGGVEVMLLSLFQTFDRRLVDPRLICLRTAGPLEEDFRAVGCEVEVLDRSGQNDWRTLPRLVARLRRRGTDVVLVTHHHRAALGLGRLAAVLARVPVNVVAVHDMDLTRLGTRCLPVWTVKTLWASSALILLSRRQREYLHREEGVGAGWSSSTREVVIPNGIALGEPSGRARQRAARSALGLRPEDVVVGAVGRLTAQKAHEDLLAAFVEVAASCREARLVLVGDGPRRAELVRLTESLGLTDRVLFTGTRRDVRRLLPAFDVFALSSVHEGLPVTVLEAMAAGLPVVATDCGSVRDVVTDGQSGFVVPVHDSPAFAARVLTLAQDASLRTAMGSDGRARVERDFRLEAVARKHESLFRELVDRR